MSRPVAAQWPVTADYGEPGTWAAGFHTGRDYGCPVGTPVHATRHGRVVGINIWGEDYGNHVVVESLGPAGKTVRHGYCHLSAVGVKFGQSIKTGGQVGRSGNTGRVFGDGVLHYEERTTPFSYNDVVRSPRFDKLS